MSYSPQVDIKSLIISYDMKKYKISLSSNFGKTDCFLLKRINVASVLIHKRRSAMDKEYLQS